MTSSLTYAAPAKINLHLRVAPPEPNGFHPLRSWMVTVGLHDTITASIADACAPGVTLSVDGHPTLGSDPTNLVYRAAVAMQPKRPIHLRLQKRVPIGAGLGGGSSDAAATLLLVNDLLSAGRSIEQLHGLAETLGSDVPFFLHGPAAIATSRGERLEACPAPAIARHAVLILPPFGISTPTAYRTLDQLRPTAAADLLDPFDVAAWAALPSDELLPLLVNDLELAAFAIEPRLDALRRDLERQLGRIVRMSGSGSTLFTLYDSAEEAEAAAMAIRSRQAPDAVGAIAVPLGTARIGPIPPADVKPGNARGFSD